MFFFKKKPLIVDCYTFDKTVYDLYPPEQAMKFIPEEWKKMPSRYKTKAFPFSQSAKMEIEQSTIKRCVGFINLFSSGFILPSWSDIKLEVTDDRVLLSHSPSNMAIVESHPSSQVWNTLYSDYMHAKIVSPWLFKCDENVKFAWNRCDWHNSERSNNFHVMSAVMDFKYQHSSHIQAFMNGQVSIKAGEPLAHIIPLTEREVKLRTHLVDNVDYNSILGTKILKYTGNYAARKKIIDSKGKCPFGFGK